MLPSKQTNIHRNWSSRCTLWPLICFCGSFKHMFTISFDMVLFCFWHHMCFFHSSKYDASSSARGQISFQTNTNNKIRNDYHIIDRIESGVSCLFLPIAPEIILPMVAFWNFQLAVRHENHSSPSSKKKLKQLC